MFRREALVALWVRLGVHRKATRTSTMIALRARRQALSISRDIAYPHVEVPPQPDASLISDADPAPPATPPREPLSYEPRPLSQPLAELLGPTPRWLQWLVTAWLVVAAVATCVIVSGL